MSTAITNIPTAVPATAHTGSTMGFVAHLDGHWRLANMLVRSGMLPKALSGKPEAAMAILLKAHELNLPAMYAFANLHFFDGRLVESAALMVGMAADRCGVTYEVVEWTDERCELLFRRPGWEKPLPSVFTIEDAKRAALTGKDNWKKYPKAMLLARAQSQGVRAIAPDRFGGMQSSEEVRDMGTIPFEGPSDHAARITAALSAGESDATNDAAESDYETVEDVETVATEDVTEARGDDRLDSHRKKYHAMLAERGMGADVDRHAFQKRLHEHALVNSESTKDWKVADYIGAIEELKAIEVVEEPA